MEDKKRLTVLPFGTPFVTHFPDTSLFFPKKGHLIYLLFILVIFSLSVTQTVQSQNLLNPSDNDVGIDEKLGEFIPMDTEFFDEEGKKVTIKELVGDKPFMISLVYFECPGICTPLLSGVAEVIARSTDLEPGKDYHFLTISFAAKEKPPLAKAKKANYMNSVEEEGRTIDPMGWRFLTGSQESIDAIADAVGFQYLELEDGYYLHPGAIMAFSPDGKLTRYLFGLTYLPFDLKMSLMEASEGRIGPTIAKALKFCFSYDPEGKKYTFNILKIMGTTTTLFGLLFLAFVVISSKKYRKKRDKEVNNNA